nr:uncharacterized protein LOC112941145 [Solanum lycopersicum]
MRDEMSRFVTRLADLVREEYRMTMLHDDMSLDRLMVYTQLIEDSKLGRITRNLKRSGSSFQGQSRFKKISQGQVEPRSYKVKFEEEGGSQNGKPTCVSCGKRHYGEYLRCTGSFFSCGKEGNLLRDFPTIGSRGREGKQVSPIVQKDDASNKRRFYALWPKGAKPDEEEDDGKSLYIFSGMSYFYVEEYGVFY